MKKKREREKKKRQVEQRKNKLNRNIGEGKESRRDRKGAENGKSWNRREEMN